MNNTLATRLLVSRHGVMNQIELASKAQVKRGYISDIERGVATNPTIKVIEALAEALGVRPEYLAGWSDDALGEDRPGNVAAGRVVAQLDDAAAAKAAQELLELWSELGAEDRRLLTDLAQRLWRAGHARVIE
jgi:transcriptional regulator with XRE-family HTH domain